MVFKTLHIIEISYLLALKVPKAFMGYDENTDGKATLAAQDIRFARTVERIQRILTSELYKIALIHLYSQGYRDDSLGNFELSLTNPSVIYDQERIELLKSKVELAESMINLNLFPTDYIYDHIFHVSEDQFDEYRDLIIEDSHRKFRIAQIQDEGNDPKETGKSYGTPHDLATMYGKGRTKPQYKGGSPLSLKEKTMLKKMDNEKRIIFEKDENIGSLLDENQIRE
jgi:hypothetical protein